MHVKPIFKFLAAGRKAAAAFAVSAGLRYSSLVRRMSQGAQLPSPLRLHQRITAVHDGWRGGQLPRLWKERRDEIGFYPAALEIVEDPPSPISHAVILIITGFLLAALLWACIGTVDIIATAQGKIIPTGRTKIVQPLEAGVVRSIQVSDGQQVKAGDVLVEIDSTITESERDRLQKENLQAELNAARLQASLAFDDDPDVAFIPPAGASSQQIATQRDLLLSQLREIRAKLEGFDQQIAQAEGNRASVLSTITKLTQSLPFLQQRARARQTLAAEGYGSKIDNFTAQQDLVEHQQEVEVQKGKLTEVTASIASLKHQRDEAAASYRQENLEDLRDAQDKVVSLHEQLIQAMQKYKLQTLVSPVDGTVQQLAVHTEGGVVTPAQTLMSIVPLDSSVEIEAMISNRDIGFVRAGQEAAVKIDTFSFTRYGLLQGKVVSVSQDAITRDKPSKDDKAKSEVGAESDSSEPSGQELVYSTRVALNQTSMMIDEHMVSLAPGMAVTVEIKTGHRRVISYLLSPIKKHLAQAIHER